MERRIKVVEENGITTMALAITIIVLIILAGITISAMSGEHGIINKANEAKIQAEISQYKEQLEVIQVNEYGKLKNGDEDQFLEQYAEAVRQDKMFKEAKKVEVVKDEEIVLVVTKEGYVFKVTFDEVIYVDDDNQNIDINNVKIEISIEPKGWTNQKVNVKIKSNAINISKKYSLDKGKTWNDYTSQFTIENNGTEIWAKGINDNNEETRYRENNN